MAKRKKTEKNEESVLIPTLNERDGKVSYVYQSGFDFVSGFMPLVNAEIMLEQCKAEGIVTQSELKFYPVDCGNGFCFSGSFVDAQEPGTEPIAEESAAEISTDETETEKEN